MYISPYHRQYFIDSYLKYSRVAVFHFLRRLAEINCPCHIAGSSDVLSSLIEEESSIPAQICRVYNWWIVVGVSCIFSNSRNSSECFSAIITIKIFRIFSEQLGSYLDKFARFSISISATSYSVRSAAGSDIIFSTSASTIARAMESIFRYFRKYSISVGFLIDFAYSIGHRSFVVE